MIGPDAKAQSGSSLPSNAPNLLDAEGISPKPPEARAASPWSSTVTVKISTCSSQTNIRVVQIAYRLELGQTTHVSKLRINIICGIKTADKLVRWPQVEQRTLCRDALSSHRA